MGSKLIRNASGTRSRAGEACIIRNALRVNIPFRTQVAPDRVSRHSRRPSQALIQIRARDGCQLIHQDQRAIRVVDALVLRPGASGHQERDAGSCAAEVMSKVKPPPKP